jgi:hypothetical protein
VFALPRFFEILVAFGQDACNIRQNGFGDIAKGGRGAALQDLAETI